MIVIRDVAEGDEAAWRRLWAGYTRFYQTDVPESATAATWRRMLDPQAPLFGRLAERDGHIVGFAVCVLHAGTWTVVPICYLEDLYVDPAARGQGVATALIQDLIERGRGHGWSRLYWHTHTGNAAARRVYDKFVKADDFVRYRLLLD